MTLKPMKPFIGKTLTELVALVSNEKIGKSEAIVCLTGDGLTRVPKTAQLFKKKLGKWVIVSGGYDNPPFSLLAQELKKGLIKEGVAAKRIILEEKSQNTWEQGIEVMKIAKRKKWKKIILVASHFHQPRAYLTFLKAMKDRSLEIVIFNAPAGELSWFERLPSGVNRFQLLEAELKKINLYQKKGHLASFKEVIDYQKWKEQK